MQNLNVEYFTNENSTELSDKELILSKYCGGIFIEHTNGLSYSMDNTHFNANDSLFLQALCSVVHPYYNTSSLQKDFQQKLKLQLYKGIDDACAINKDHKMKDCDIYRYVTKIYTAVMSEIFKIKWAHVSQIYTSETISEDMTKRVAAVFSGYFNMRLEEKEYQKKFPATSTMIDRDQKFFAKTLKTLFIINNDELYKNSGK